MSNQHITKQQKKGNVLSLTFKGDSMDQSMVNAFRRILMGELKTYSLMGNFTIHSNTSIFNDEYLESRVKMVPIYVKDPSNLELFEERLIFHLCEEDNPKNPLVNEEDLDLMVTSHMFQIYDEYGNKKKYDIKDVIPYDFPLLKLRKGQEFHLSVESADGIGKIHTSWKSAIATYKFENRISDQPPPEKGDKSIKTNPITGEIIETIEDKKAYKRDKNDNPAKITLTIKGTGHYDPEVCFLLTLDNLEEKLQNFLLLVDNPMVSQQGDQSTKIEVIPSTDIENYVQIKVTDPDDARMPLATHTLGNLLSNHMFYNLNNKVKENLDKIRESMCSYRVPHPLDAIIYINIKTPENLYKDSERYPALELLNETTEDILRYIAEIRKEFKQHK